MKVLLQNSHHQTGRNDGWSGAPSEANYVTVYLNPRIVARARDKYGIEVVLVDGDMMDHPQYHANYDAFIAPHYEADIHYTLPPPGHEHEEQYMRCGLVPVHLMQPARADDDAGGPDEAGHVGGWFWGRAANSLSAAKDDQLGQIFREKYQQVIGNYNLPYRAHWNNPNVTDYYAFRLTSVSTPGILVELGVGSPVPHVAPDHDFLRREIDHIAEAFVDTLAQFGGISVPTPDPTLTKEVLGTDPHTADDLYNYGKSKNPNFPRELADLYFQLAPASGVRATVGFGQMLKETGNWTFLTPQGTPPASGYNASWNNPCGLGVTGPYNVGNRFPTLMDGVKAHLGHLLCYFGPHVPAFCDADPRHAGVGHRNYPNDMTLLGGRDEQNRIKWAPGVDYGKSLYELYVSKIPHEENEMAGLSETQKAEVAEMLKKAIDDMKGGLKADYIDKGEFTSHDHRGGTVTYTKNE